MRQRSTRECLCGWVATVSGIVLFVTMAVGLSTMLYVLLKNAFYASIRNDEL